MNRLVQAIKMGWLEPKAAAMLAADPVSIKRLRNFTRYEKRTARARTCKRPSGAQVMDTPNPRFLKHIAFTRARVMTAPTENVGVPCRCGNGHPDGSICSVPE